MRSILNDCIEIQSEAIKKFEPDVVVASSFGAAVALFGLLEQRFHIPLVLCASAHESAHSVWFNISLFRTWMERRKCSEEERYQTIRKTPR